MDYCKSCGNPIEEGFAFCTNCGARLDAAAAPAPEAQSTSQATPDMDAVSEQITALRSGPQPPVNAGVQQPPVYGGQQPPVYGGQQPPVYGGQQPQRSGAQSAGNFKLQTQSVDRTAEFSPDDIAANKTNAILSYFGLLVLIPLLSAKQSPYAQFHANQGLVMLIAEFVCSILSAIPFVGFVAAVAAIALFVFQIMGIVNAAKGQAKELPFVGGIKLLK